VSELSSDWGVDADGAGKTVWVELSTAAATVVDEDETDIDALLDAFSDLSDDAGQPDGAGPAQPALRLAA
jgi:hypothetical protein